jgi:hypothetical protein
MMTNDEAQKIANGEHVKGYTPVMDGDALDSYDVGLIHARRVVKHDSTGKFFQVDYSITTHDFEVMPVDARNDVIEVFPVEVTTTVYA